MAKKSKFSGYIDATGSWKVMEKLAKLSTNLKKDLEPVFMESFKIVEGDLKQFMIDHAGKHSGKHTYDTFVEAKVGEFRGKRSVGIGEEGMRGFASRQIVYNEETTIFLETGYSLEDGGLPALFWDIGTPTNTPKAHYFVFYAIQDHFQEIKKQQTEAIQKIIERYMR